MEGPGQQPAQGWHSEMVTAQRVSAAGGPCMPPGSCSGLGLWGAGHRR